MKKSEKDQKVNTDWQKIKSDLETARENLQKGWDPSGLEKEKVLEARTRELAGEEEDGKQAEEHIDIVLFLLASEHYGIELKHVREVYPLRDFASLPGTPPFVMGLINQRGQIQTVIDIKKFFNLPEKGISDLNKVILVHTPGMEVGILADTVEGIRSVPCSEIQKSLPVLTDKRADYTKGITKRQVVILDIEKILSDERIIVNENIEQ